MHCLGVSDLRLCCPAAIGLIQEGKAEKAAEALKAMLSANAQVLRDGEVTTIPADELVSNRSCRPVMSWMVVLVQHYLVLNDPGTEQEDGS